MDQWPQSLKTALGMMLSSSFPKAIVWGPALITFHNDALEPILGDKLPAIGRPFSDVWDEAWPELKPMVDKAFAGEATFLENFPLTLSRRGFPEPAYFTFCYSPIRVESGEVGGMMDTVIETTDTVVAQEQLGVVNAELAHRMRNLLTMVSAVASMSLRHARDIEEARASIAQRLSALSRNQSLLLVDGASEASIQELLEQALAPHPQLRDRVKISGPELRLSSKLAVALALALNELITNAIKYGALSHPNGVVSVTWDPAAFSFTWQERGNARVEKPTREGFGTRVLMRFVSTSFSGQARRHFGDDGFIYELTAPPQIVGISA
jgi:two-component sensor histidine kinase